MEVRCVITATDHWGWGALRHREQSENNHFMYWVARARAPHNFKPPTKKLSMDFKRWLNLARQADTEPGRTGPNDVHHYLMTGVEAGRVVAKHQSSYGNFISNDLSIFSTTKENFFITAVGKNKGIQCRFGMKNVIAEAHYDGGRNMVAMLKGAKRYILTAPSECKKLNLIRKKEHPSFRHSTTDWSNLEEAKRAGFGDVDAIDTILHAGEVLYIPSYWIHYIISLDYSIQCNSRSGSPPNREGEGHIVDCMGQSNVPHMRKPKS